MGDLIKSLFWWALAVVVIVASVIRVIKEGVVSPVLGGVCIGVTIIVVIIVLILNSVKEQNEHI